MPSVFARDPKRHRIKKVKIDDEAGRAIPEPVIAQLDRHLHLLSCPVIYRGWTQDQMDQMFRTLYLVMRDTGRRPREVCSLRVDCLDHTSDGALLIWDNHKSGRRSRRLPITGGTAEIIEAWRTVRLGLISGDVRDRYLFPARTLGVPDPYFMPANLSDGLRVWVHDTIPSSTATAWTLLACANPSTGTGSTPMRSGTPTPSVTPTLACRSTSCGT